MKFGWRYVVNENHLHRGQQLRQAETGSDEVWSMTEPMKLQWGKQELYHTSAETKPKKIQIVGARIPGSAMWETSIYLLRENDGMVIRLSIRCCWFQFYNTSHLCSTTTHAKKNVCQSLLAFLPLSNRSYKDANLVQLLAKKRHFISQWELSLIAECKGPATRGRQCKSWQCAQAHHTSWVTEERKHKKIQQERGE